MMINLHYQFDCISSWGNISQGVSVRLFSECFNRRGKTHSECGLNYPVGKVLDRIKEERRASLLCRLLSCQLDTDLREGIITVKMPL